jgi:hypothetical protein
LIHRKKFKTIASKNEKLEQFKIYEKKPKDLHFVDLSVVTHMSKNENLKSKNRYFSLKLLFSTFKISADLEAI